MRFLFALVLFCACSGSTQRQPVSVEVEGDLKLSLLSSVVAELQSDPVSGFVLMHKDASQWSSAEKARADHSPARNVIALEGQHFDLHMSDSVERSDLYNWGSPFICRRVIADHGDVVEVIALDDDEVVPEKMGHGGLGADYIYELVTFVRKQDLIPVLSAPCKYAYTDGTEITLFPGVAVGIPWDGNELSRVVSAHQLHFQLEVPDSLLALSYDPIIEDLIDVEDQDMLDEQSSLIIGGEEFCPVSEIRSSRLRTPLSMTEQDGHLYVELREQGIWIKARTDLPAIPFYYPNIESPTLTAVFPTPPRWNYRIDEGTTVYWEDGSEAGTVRQFFSYASTIGPEGSTWCEIHRELLPNEAICFKTKDIEVIDNAAQED